MRTIDVLIIVSLLVTSFISFQYANMPYVTARRIQEATNLCAERGLAHLKVSVTHFTVACNDGAEYKILATTSKE